MTEIVLEGHFDPIDRDLDEFRLLPFEVPPGIVRLRVRYHVSRPLSAVKLIKQHGT